MYFEFSLENYSFCTLLLGVRNDKGKKPGVKASENCMYNGTAYFAVPVGLLTKIGKMLQKILDGSCSWVTLSCRVPALFKILMRLYLQYPNVCLQCH